MNCFQVLIFLAAGGFFLSCGDEGSSQKCPVDVEQLANLQILNAFSSTDSAIRSIAFNSEIIESINDDRGSKSNGRVLEHQRGWSILLKPDVSPEKRAELVNFLAGLSNAYEELNREKSDRVPGFDFSFELADQGSRIEVRAKGAFGKKG